jgi:predicted porin
VVKLDNGISFGAAFNTYDIPPDVEAIVGYTTDRANSYIVGIKYKNPKIYVALDYNFNQSEIQYPGDTIVAFPGNGVELKFDYWFTKKIVLETGGNYFLPTETPAVISPDFEIFQIYLGGAYYFLPDFLVYTDFKLDAGTNTSGNTPNNVFVVGLRYNFSFGKSQIKL